MEPTLQEVNDFYEAISKCGTKPAILSLILGYFDGYIPKQKRGLLPAPLTSLYEEDNLALSLEELQELSRGVTLSLTGEMVIPVQRETIGQSNTKLWFRLRAGRITASQLRSACQSNPMNRLKSLVKKICYPGSHNCATKATRWGIQHEKVATFKYEKFMADDHTNFAVIDTGHHLNPRWPFLGASPDCLVRCSCFGMGVCEIKCPFSARDLTVDEAVKTPNCCLVSIANNAHHLSRNHPYYYRIQAQLHVSGRDYCHFIFCTSKDFYVERIQPDFEMWEEAVEKTELFFRRAILPELMA
ncbi:uncharacterized protein LOC133493835 [Syngnathoides biaculeatus]|uniref:uncharacterized protein LOC133493835 n=1 Tax=Syngnathoides biaculeatus TaxID=300417 RepID=UPI002ADD655C|nr:uncharacterized protein LOC133493835 [Syngnathoides biaculeatus]